MKTCKGCMLLKEDMLCAHFRFKVNPFAATECPMWTPHPPLGACPWTEEQRKNYNIAKRALSNEAAIHRKSPKHNSPAAELTKAERVDLIITTARKERGSIYIYFIRETGTESPVKIGSARRAKTRLSTLQMGNHRSLEIAGIVTGCTREDEKLIHALMSDKRIRGEWYDCQLAIGLAEEASEGMSRELLYKRLRQRIGRNTAEGRNILRAMRGADTGIAPTHIRTGEYAA